MKSVVKRYIFESQKDESSPLEGNNKLINPFATSNTTSWNIIMLVVPRKYFLATDSSTDSSMWFINKWLYRVCHKITRL